MEAEFQSAQFDAELFSMANDTDFVKKDVEVWETVDFVIGDDEYKVVIENDTTAITLETPEALTYMDDQVMKGAEFFINGFEKASTADTGKFTVGVSALDAESGVYKTVITLGEELEDGNEVIITYRTTKANQKEILVDNQSTFVGEMVLRWPRHTWAA